MSIQTDNTTSAGITIDYSHHEVHEGSAYWSYHTVSLGNGEVITMGYVTPDTYRWSHLLFRVDLTSGGVLDILEDVTSFDQGDAFSVFNFHRNSTKTSGCTVTTGATGATLITPTGGSEIWNESLGTRGQQTTRDNASELVMKQNSKYLFRFTNDANACVATILLTWYEHTNTVPGQF